MKCAIVDVPRCSPHKIIRKSAEKGEIGSMCGLSETVNPLIKSNNYNGLCDTKTTLTLLRARPYSLNVIMRNKMHPRVGRSGVHLDIRRSY